MKISLMIPCHNEENGLARSILSALYQTRKIDQILVINDGSTDKTRRILNSFVKKFKNIHSLQLKKNTGNKSRAQEQGLGLLSGDIVIMTDGDTILDPVFVENVEKVFLADGEKKIAAVNGRVKSLKHNWLTACRDIDYTIGFDVFKQAQSIIGYVFVMPGCATAIRREVLTTLSFNHDTVTEDLDFTYQIHLKGFTIVFERSAVVFTQDPPNLSSYIRQMRRWFGGGWQNLIKYYPIVFKNPVAALELSLLFVEGLFYSIFLFVILVLYPTFFIFRVLPFYFLITLFFAAYAAMRNKRMDLIFYSPCYLFIVFLNASIFIFEFVNEVILRKKNLVWLKSDRVKF